MLKVAEMMLPLSCRSGLALRIWERDSRRPMAARVMRLRMSPGPGDGGTLELFVVVVFVAAFAGDDVGLLVMLLLLLVGGCWW